MELSAVDPLEPDLHRRIAVVVRAREVDVRVRVEEELLLVAVDAYGEPAAVALACLSGEALAADAERDPAGARSLDLRKGEGELPNGVPIGHLRVSCDVRDDEALRCRPHGAPPRHPRKIVSARR